MSLLNPSVLFCYEFYLARRKSALRYGIRIGKMRSPRPGSPVHAFYFKERSGFPDDVFEFGGRTEKERGQPDPETCPPYEKRLFAGNFVNQKKRSFAILQLASDVKEVSGDQPQSLTTFSNLVEGKTMLLIWIKLFQKGFVSEEAKRRMLFGRVAPAFDQHSIDALGRLSAHLNGP